MCSLEITWYGNATLKISSGSSAIMLDPYYCRNPSLPRLWLDDLEDVDAILLTHGHFDHAFDAVEISRKTGIPIHAPQEVLGHLADELGASALDLRPTQPGARMLIGDLRIRPLEATHVRIDPLLIARGLGRALKPSRLRTWKQLPGLLRDHARCPEGRCVAWYIQCHRKSLFHLGSLGLEPNETYPSSPTILSLPLQGHSRIEQLALEVIEEISPQIAFLHHFDDAFPPISQPGSPQRLIEHAVEQMPGLQVCVPRYRRPMQF